jgi:hypothetical protein
MGKKSSSRYQQLVMSFAASSFALLALLSVQQLEANTVTAEVVRHAPVLTNYRASGNCIAQASGKKVVHFRMCRRVK